MLDGFSIFKPDYRSQKDQNTSLFDISRQLVVLQTLIDTDSRFARVRAKQSIINAGDLIGVRPNLNSPKSAPLPVQTIHRGKRISPDATKGFWTGEVLAYVPFVTLKNAYFKAHPKAQQQIASGKISKFPMASVDGEFCNVQKIDLSGIEIRFNPKINQSFIDRNGRSVRFAEEVTVLGNCIYARGRIIRC